MVEGIAIVSQTPAINMRELARVSAAIQTQVIRDVAPAWEASAPINAFFRLEDAPLGHLTVVIRDDISPAITGIHRFEGLPVGVVALRTEWSVLVSRVVLDLLVNPEGNRRMVGPAPVADQTDVEFITAVSNAGQRDFVYDVHGYAISDFAHPAYYRGGNGPYCATGRLSRPGQIAPDGCLTWWDATSGRWWQKRGTTGQPELVAIDLDGSGDMHEQLRMLVDRPSEAVPTPTDPRGSTIARPAGATHRAQRLNAMLNGLYGRAGIDLTAPGPSRPRTERR
ncbi:MAG: hypothetical protein OEY23_10605 [Acidimicrobiia bacterium]|nr:hypothetical protein [Acidimicrobiia bacterium]